MSIRVDSLESKIRRIEGFDVHILHPDGRNARGDMKTSSNYGYRRAAPNNFTVANWIETRFDPNYAGYKVQVLNASGTEVHGPTLLSSVRDTYE